MPTARGDFKPRPGGWSCRNPRLEPGSTAHTAVRPELPLGMLEPPVAVPSHTIVGGRRPVNQADTSCVRARDKRRQPPAAVLTWKSPACGVVIDPSLSVGDLPSAEAESAAKSARLRPGRERLPQGRYFRSVSLVNKAFVREPDGRVEYCPRCGSAGEAVGRATVRAHVPAGVETRVAELANFCPAPQCAVAYFDVFERVILASELLQPVYPKDPDAPLCACFGLTRSDIEQDIREGGVARTRSVIERAQSSDARCSELAANGRPCTAHVQRYFIKVKGDRRIS